MNNGSGNGSSKGNEKSLVDGRWEEKKCKMKSEK
jgi:hypothetical protein